MGTTRKRLVAAVASLAAAAFVAGCGGDSDSGSGPTDTTSQTVSADVPKGGTVFSLEQSVTQSWDPQRTYTGRDIANMGRLFSRSLVIFPVGETDATKGEASDAEAEVDETRATQPNKAESTEDDAETLAQADDLEPARDDDAVADTDAAAPGNAAASQADAAGSTAGLVWLAMMGATALAAVALWIARRLRARSNVA